MRSIPIPQPSRGIFPPRAGAAARRAARAARDRSSLSSRRLSRRRCGGRRGGGHQSGGAHSCLARSCHRSVGESGSLRGARARRAFACVERLADAERRVRDAHASFRIRLSHGRFSVAPPLQPAPAGGAPWRKRIADSHRWIGPNKRKSPARVERRRTRRARHTSGRAKRPVRPDAKAASRAISVVVSV